jgi:VWFA-related protein
MKKNHRLFSLDQLLLFVLIVLLSCTAHAQTATAGRAASETPVFRSETQLVIVDVTVVNKAGQPVRGLKREDFTLTENKQPQAVRNFEEYSRQVTLISGPQLPPMPIGTFTNYTPVAPNGPLNILLLDALNTPMADQSYVRYELQQYAKKAKPGTRIAVFGLSSRLFLLQGFSSDPDVLKDAVEHKLLPHASSLLDDPSGSGDASSAPSGIVADSMSSYQDSLGVQLTSVVSSMQQFEAEQKSFQTELRIRYTLDALNALAHYLSAFPGRKNLIWFSGSFPIDILPDPTIENAFAVMENNDAEFRETTNLLSRAQVAVYPVDARGVMNLPTVSAASRKGDLTGTSAEAFFRSKAGEHMTMAQLAENTGGRAFYDTNDLGTAVQDAIEFGSSYYSLAYQPPNDDRNGPYREIRVALNGNLRAAGYTLAYRHGYYTEGHADAFRGAASSAAAGGIASINSDDRYTQAAMAHGAPTPADILFKVRVLPLGTIAEQTLAQNNIADPEHPIQPPFRRFVVDLAAVPDAFQLTLNQNGRHTGAIEFSVLLYDQAGKLLNATGKKVELNLTPDAYRGFLSGVKGHFEMSVPVKGIDDFLRIGIHDLRSNRFGVVEIPVASVARLAPAPSTPPH